MGNGKFDAAIRWLYDTCAFDQKQNFEEGESYRSAIRVLEAAAKVDKRCAIETIVSPGEVVSCQEERGVDDCRACCDKGCHVTEIIALLSALPDPGKEEGK